MTDGIGNRDAYSTAPLVHCLKFAFWGCVIGYFLRQVLQCLLDLAVLSGWLAQECSSVNNNIWFIIVKSQGTGQIQPYSFSKLLTPPLAKHIGYPYIKLLLQSLYASLMANYLINSLSQIICLATKIGTPHSDKYQSSIFFFEAKHNYPPTSNPLQF